MQGAEHGFAGGWPSLLVSRRAQSSWPGCLAAASAKQRDEVQQAHFLGNRRPDPDSGNWNRKLEPKSTAEQIAELRLLENAALNK